MDETPDYRRYNLAQLEDIARHINREKYPERFELLCEAIAEKLNGPPTPPPPREPFWYCALRALQYLFGLASLFFLLTDKNESPDVLSDGFINFTVFAGLWFFCWIFRLGYRYIQSGEH